MHRTKKGIKRTICYPLTSSTEHKENGYAHGVNCNEVAIRQFYLNRANLLAHFKFELRSKQKQNKKTYV